jgi:hypothetical protein
LKQTAFIGTVKMATKLPRRFKTLLTDVGLRNTESSTIMDLVSRSNKAYGVRNIDMGSAAMCSTTHTILSAHTQCGKDDE